MNETDWELSGEEFRSLRLALQSAFPSIPAFKRMVRENMPEYVAEIQEGSLSDVVGSLIALAESQNQIKRLVINSVNEIPGNPQIQVFCETHIDKLIEFNDSLFSDSDFVSLFAILKTIDFPILWDIGQTILPKTISRDRPESIQKLKHPELSNWFKCFILLQLLMEDFPSFEQQPSILVFVSHLSIESVLEGTKAQTLVEWLNNVDPNFNSRTGELATSLTNSIQPVRGRLQAYLMIMVNPEKPKLRATASLLCIAPTGMKKEISVHLNPEERGILTTTKKLPQIVAQFIKQSISVVLEHPENMLGCAYHELTIELFLPIRYLCEPIDRWEIKDDFDNPVSLGSKYPLVVRSYDRVIKPQLRNDFAKAWSWRKEWLAQNPEPTALDKRICHLTEIDCIRMSTFRETLKEKIGIKITCPLPESEAEMLKFLQAMLESGISMGTWTRSREQLTAHSAVEVNQCWSSDLILNHGEFLERVRGIRAFAFDEQESPEQHWGGHLTVLWDDLERMPVLEPLHSGGN
jgi:vWA-MoxR associated protein C-terminal domain/Effector-associated domain 1